MVAWKLALIVSVIAMSLGYAFYTPEPKPVPESIAVHSSAPEDHVIIEAP